MARNNKKAQSIESGMNIILATEPEKTIEEAAKFIGCAEVHVLELFSERLNLPEAMLWESIPTEHEALLEEFKRQWEASQTVRVEDSEPEAQALLETSEPLLEQRIEEEPKEKKKRIRRNSTALTQTKTDEITQTVEGKEKLAVGEEETLQILYGEKGRASGSNLATSELYIRQLAYSQTKGEALNREIAVLVQDIVKLGQFSPEEIAQKLGLDSSPKQFSSIQEVVAMALSKIHNASEEIHDTAWTNGKNAQVSLSMLDSLMS